MYKVGYWGHLFCKASWREQRGRRVSQVDGMNSCPQEEEKKRRMGAVEGFRMSGGC